MKNHSRLVITLSLLFIFSCEVENNQEDIKLHPVSLRHLSGFVQKGPFINGTSIMIFELDSQFTQTGRAYSTQIIDNKGKFELSNLEFSTQFAELKADGYYFNEVSGEKSLSQLTLYAFTDLTNKDSINMNILSSLERPRIKYLLANGHSYNDAKKQAQKEVLNIFSLKKSDIPESELLDISKAGDDNAILLAISAIMQGYGSEADLSELLADIITDIREDGVLDSKATGSILINHGKFLKPSIVRANLVNRYEQLGLTPSISDFEKYVKQFVDCTAYEVSNFIVYPEFSPYGENILFGDKVNFEPDHLYSMAANLPEGSELKVILKGGLWWYRFLPNGPINWLISEYNMNAQSQVFTAAEPNRNCDLMIEFSLPRRKSSSAMYESVIMSDTIMPDTIIIPEIKLDTITIEYYENSSKTPSKTKFIYIE